MSASSLRPRTVYFIRPIGMRGPIKIGCSCSPTARKAALATWSPFPLEIVAEIQGSFEIERRFHALFMCDHQGHEWFRWSSDLQGVIEAICSGSFDIETLPEPQFIKPLRRKNGNGWTERTKRIQSYRSRIRHVGNKFGRFLPVSLQDWTSYVEDRERMRPVDAFLADPVANGITETEKRAEKIAHLRELGTDWARKQIALLEAA